MYLGIVQVKLGVLWFYLLHRVPETTNRLRALLIVSITAEQNEGIDLLI